ncbi:23S rRNA (pseudouridine(1915)-N(3))-methyltransferase RlmH [Granulibacter bethesdensis]|uniref:23S rRNA (pseudouridine(1915)-N(3))-methyltransferase RlmH n=1 Tax=Granulibacter bethesdensis TaxID=364410 RepID=UPI0003F1C9F1|nr:23S rRNA (pseudouridine(1915)-N(3))-methyltransferase RlmH [Granulibacter bethesdensis]AHJ65812.1 putative cytosolic protein [Granulibacter bethesdensis CGDNIH4]
MTAPWRIIAVGRMRGSEEETLFKRYAARLRPALTVTEIAEARGSTAEIRRRETSALLAALPPACIVVAMDLGGRAHDSEALATLARRWREQPLPVCFMIGGAEGLEQPVLDRADHVLSLGPMTWPHLLVRPLLAEQLYRAQAIATNHPYHRTGRPSG